MPSFCSTIFTRARISSISFAYLRPAICSWEGFFRNGDLVANIGNVILDGHFFADLADIIRGGHRLANIGDLPMDGLNIVLRKLLQ